MGETTETITLRRSVVQHPLICEGDRIDTLSGAEYTLYTCPWCTFQQRQFPDGRIETMRDDAITAADAAEFRELATTPAGRLEVSRRLRRAPGHNIMVIGSEDEWRKLAEQLGPDMLEKFEALVDQAIVAGEPLLTFGMDGSMAAETWPKGTGPNQGG